MEWDLMHKTMFHVTGLRVSNAPLDLAAAAAASALGLTAGEVIVVEAAEDHLAFDVLRQKVESARITGRQTELLEALAAVPGIECRPEAAVSSRGILGMISVPENAFNAALAERMAHDVASHIAQRAVVFSTGDELISETIEDTNAPFLLQELKSRGYRAQFGGILTDRGEAVRQGILSAAEQGYGLIITTGGVGAQKKDCLVDTTLSICPQASAPSYMIFPKDHGWHFREEVRICVGTLGSTRIVNLPGPHSEVRAVTPALMTGLSQGLSDPLLAELLASVLRDRWKHMADNHQTTKENH